MIKELKIWLSKFVSIVHSLHKLFIFGGWIGIDI